MVDESGVGRLINGQDQPVYRPMSELKLILELYAEFEAKIQRYGGDFFHPHCSVCTEICCHVDICREALESPFLELLRKDNPMLAKFNGENGWLSDTGCTLSVGRPPVCYEFLCRDIIDTQPTASHQYVFSVLAKLVSHIGKRAHRGKHIVEIIHIKQLDRVNLSTFEKRLQESMDAFDAIRSFNENHFLSSNHLQRLNRIQKITPKIARGMG